MIKNDHQGSTLCTDVGCVYICGLKVFLYTALLTASRLKDKDFSEKLIYNQHQAVKLQCGGVMSFTGPSAEQLLVY